MKAFLLGVAASVLVATVPAAASGANACERLPGRDLAPVTSVKLVVSRDRLVSCALRRGELHTLAFRSRDLLGGERFRVERVVGRSMLLRTAQSDQYGSYDATRVVDLGTGGGYTLGSRQHEVGQDPMEDFGVDVATAVMSPGRRAAAMRVSLDGTRVQLVAFDQEGGVHPLDSGTPEQLPPASLTLEGGRLRWSSSGQPRSVALSSASASSSSARATMSSWRTTFRRHRSGIASTP